MSDVCEIYVFSANSHTAIIKNSTGQMYSRAANVRPCSWSPHFLSQNCSTATKQGQKPCLSLLKSNIQHVLMMGQSCRFFTQWSIPPAERWMWTSGMDGQPSFWLNKIKLLWLHSFVFQVNCDTCGSVWLTHRLYWCKVIGPDKNEIQRQIWPLREENAAFLIHIIKKIVVTSWIMWKD